MNQIAELVSDSLSGKTSAVITMNGKYYTIRSPKTKLVALILKPLSRIKIDEYSDESQFHRAIRDSIEQYPYMDECIALCILGDRAFGWLSKFRLWMLKRKLSFASDEERATAFIEIKDLLIPRGFFLYARAAMILTGQMTESTKQSEEIPLSGKSQGLWKI